LGHKEEAAGWLRKAVARTDQELRDNVQSTSLDLWVRKPTLELLRAETEAVLRGGRP
jgi:hypothetical protein